MNVAGGEWRTAGRLKALEELQKTGGGPRKQVHIDAPGTVPIAAAPHAELCSSSSISSGRGRYSSRFSRDVVGGGATGRLRGRVSALAWLSRRGHEARITPISEAPPVASRGRLAPEPPTSVAEAGVEPTLAQADAIRTANDAGG